MKLLLSHPTGNANVRAALDGFLESDMLLEFHTSIACFEGSILDKISSIKLFSEIRRRSFNPELRRLTKCTPAKEIARLLFLKAGFPALTRNEKSIFSVDSVYKSVDKKAAANLKKLLKKKLTAVYAYEDGAEMSFNQAKKLSLKCLYDLPIGYWRASKQLLEKEKELWPDWASTLTGLKDSPDKLIRKDNELSMADKIFVASRFTAKTLELFPGKLAEIRTISYGFPQVTNNRDYSSLKNRKLKILFVGSLSQRKGIANMFAAINKMSKHIQLTIIGKRITDDCFVLDKELNKHTWIPALSHENILKTMQEHDVLIFPSLFEGFGLVITEAMSQGTPVITTERTAGPDLISNDQNGWLIEAGSTRAIEEILENLLSDTKKISEIGRQALETARKRPWDVYGKELAFELEKG